MMTVPTDTRSNASATFSRMASRSVITSRKPARTVASSETAANATSAFFFSEW